MSAPALFKDLCLDANDHQTLADIAADLATFRAEIATYREAAKALDLDHIEVTPDGRRFALRWIYTHMLEEYARHNGHADLLRFERDGATGE